MSLSTDELGNQLCKALGRKEYRQQIKLVKSLEIFLRNHCLAAVDINAGDESTLSLHFDSDMSKVYLRNTLKVGVDNHLSTEDVPTIGDAAVLPTRKLNDEEIVEDGKKLESSDKELSFHLSKEDAQLLLPCPEMIFETGDIFEVVWWTEADVAYAASLLFSECMMLRLTEKVLLMKPGAWFISLKPLVNLFSQSILGYRSFHIMLFFQNRYCKRRSSGKWFCYAVKASFECLGKWPRSSCTSDTSLSEVIVVR